VDGYFINHSYYQEILLLNIENESLKKQNKLLNENISFYLNIKTGLQKEIEYYEKQRKYDNLKTSIMVGSIAVNFSLLALIIGGVYFYSIK
jgi:hypothetical protein